MAEYLCEEDMNTGEYISRDAALRQLNATCLATDCDNYNGVRCRACAYADAMDFIDAIPAADVQSVNQWISVKDRLPDDSVEVLVYDTDCGIVIGWYDKEIGDFAADFISPLDAVTHWQPLPEKPQD